MKRLWRQFALTFSIAALTLSSLTVLGRWHAVAKSLPPRWREEVVVETLYTWWLAPWASPEDVACELRINHPEQPTFDDVYRFCGWDLYKAWRATPACEAATEGGDVTSCPGYYLHFVKQEEVEHTVIRVYPLPQVHLSLKNCTPDLPHFRCANDVVLRLTANEPLPGAHIEGMRVLGVGGGTISCDGDACEVLLPAKDKAFTYRLRITAISSAEKSNRMVTASVRITPTDEGNTIVDVISPAWDDVGADMCERAWEAMPPTENLPAWARTPDTPDDLATFTDYAYLAGRLIAADIVDASDCPQGGLQANGVANACGMLRAHDDVIAWQNRFDAQIWESAQAVGIPAVLFKRVLAEESQFWPAQYPGIPEVGFGQLSAGGLDTLLLWDPELFQNMCQDMLGAWKCVHGYSGLSEPQRTFLYGSLWVQADLTCSDCQGGIDMSRIGSSLDLFARLLRANCRQMGQTVRNITRSSPGKVSTYEDMWHFTIAAYNCPDCIYEALLRTHNTKDLRGRREPLDWEHVRQHFPPGCESTLQYTEHIFASQTPTPSPENSTSSPNK